MSDLENNPSFAMEIARFGGPDVFRRVDSKTAKPQSIKPDQIRVEVKAAGVNFADVMMRMGLYPEAPKPPFVPGYEVAGIVVEKGDQVREFELGNRVFGALRFGGYSTRIVTEAANFRKIPEKLSDADAASIPVNFVTAWIALQDMARIRMNDRVLVTSSAGGVGVAAVQIAKQAGANIVGLTSSEEKAEFVRSLGASEVWMNDELFSKQKESGQGFDVILDSVGGDHLKKSMKMLAPTGRVVTFGVSTIVSGKKRSLWNSVRTLLNTPFIYPINLMHQNTGIFGLNVLQLVSHPKVMLGALDHVLDGFEDGKLRAIVGKEFPLIHAGAAHEHLTSRKNTGKVVLTN